MEFPRPSMHVMPGGEGKHKAIRALNTKSPDCSENYGPEELCRLDKHHRPESFC